MQISRVLSAGFFGLLVISWPCLADDDELAVVELFTSQGCYSCPPAEAFLRELVHGQPRVLALEFHVDYWDDLVYGASGKWKDPFSDPSYTLRQRGYNERRLDGRRGVYTPQMIIDGRHAEVGSDRARITSVLNQATGPKPLRVRVAPADNGMVVTVAGSQNSQASIWLVRFDREAETAVTAGENQGKMLISNNVVREFRRIGEWQGREVKIPIRIELDQDQGCAVLVQDPAPGPVLGVGRCPGA